MCSVVLMCYSNFWYIYLNLLWFLFSDYASGFGGKYGVQADRVDKSAVGFDYQGKTEKHESQKGWLHHHHLFLLIWYTAVVLYMIKLNYRSFSVKVNDWKLVNGDMHLGWDLSLHLWTEMHRDARTLTPCCFKKSAAPYRIDCLLCCWPTATSYARCSTCWTRMLRHLLI